MDLPRSSASEGNAVPMWTQVLLQKSKQVLPNARSSVNEPGIKELKREAVTLARGGLSKSSWRSRGLRC